MEIILVNPGGTPAGGDTNKASKTNRYMYPYGIIYVYNYLAKQNIRSKVFDLYISRTEDLIEYCQPLEFPIIGITSQTYSSIITIDIIRKVKSANPSAIIVVGGKHFTYADVDALNTVDEIDIVVRGEGEITFYELVKALRENQELGAIDGITYKEDGKIVKNKEREQIRDIEKVSLDYERLPNLDLFSKGIYLRNFEREKIKSLPVFLGRGCSQKCVFCIYNKFRYRVRNLESVIAEVKYLKEKLNYCHFTFSDPSFCERTKFATEFCERLITDRLNIKWSCEARVDTPFELLELMAEAGCISIDFALESGSDKVLRAIKKSINVSRVIDFAKACKSLNIRSHVFIMVSLPEETERDVHKTISLARELSKYCSSMSIGVTQIHPGTELEQIAYKKRILPPDFSYHDPKFFHSNTDLCDKNVPLYIENLSIDFIKKSVSEIATIKNVDYDSLHDLFFKALWGARKIPSQSLSRSIQGISRFARGIWGKTKKAIVRRF